MNPEEAFAEIKQVVDGHRAFLNKSRPTDWNVIEEHQLWFRGEARTYPSTKSTLSREVTSFEKGPEQIQMYQMWIYTKVRKFLFENHRALFEEFSDSWNYPFLMQHYGIPTCFIDFTPSLETALYFATLKADTLSPEANEDEIPVLWLFDPTTFNYYERNKNNYGEVKDYNVGSPMDGNFYDFMVFGGEWGEGDSYHDVVKNARDLVGKPQFVHGVSSAVSPHSTDRRASESIKRMFSQTGYFFYSANQFVDLEWTISRAFYRQEVRYSKEDIGNIDARLLKKIKISVKNAQLIKTYLQEKGYNNAYFGFDRDIEGLNKDEYSFKTYLEETNGGYDYRDGDDFIKTYIAPLEVWLDD